MRSAPRSARAPRMPHSWLLDRSRYVTLLLAARASHSMHSVLTAGDRGEVQEWGVARGRVYGQGRRRAIECAGELVLRAGRRKHQLVSTANTCCRMGGLGTACGVVGSRGKC